ncbi:MAG: SIS domain-containing protein [Polyangiales bacterium]|nr:SIS domain-containing protein [Myxococcales bacterium]
MTGSSHMELEIAEQPAMLRERADAWMTQAKAIHAQCADRSEQVVVGRGSSGHACMFFSYVAGARTGRPALELRPWVTTQPTGPARWDAATLYAFSASGQSTDVAHAATWMRERGGYVVGVSNNADPEANLARAANTMFDLSIGPEVAVPATKSFTAQLFAAAALAGEDVRPAATECAAALEQIAESNLDETLAGFVEGARSLIFVARGPALAAAADAALKFRETCAVPSVYFSSAEFLHGPVGAVGPADRVVLLEDTTDAKSMEAVLAQLLAREAPHTIIVPRIPGAPAHALRIAVPEVRWARTIALGYATQRAALMLAKKLGFNPDEPRGLRKVTLT